MPLPCSVKIYEVFQRQTRVPHGNEYVQSNGDWSCTLDNDHQGGSIETRSDMFFLRKR